MARENLYASLKRALAVFGICMGVAAIGLLVSYFHLPDEEPLTADEFRTICERNGYDVTDKWSTSLPDGSLKAEKGNHFIYYSVHADEAELEQHFEEAWERDREWSEGLPCIKWQDREIFQCAKWGHYQIFARNGKVEIYGYYDLNAHEWFGRESLDHIFRELGC